MTGGQESSSWSSVSLYNRDGFVKTLDRLNDGRYHHACGSFQNQDGNTVSNESDIVYDKHQYFRYTW